MTSDIERLTQFVRKDPTVKLNSLMGMIFRPEGLSDSFARLAGNRLPESTELLRLRTTVKDPNWEPDGVTLQVRFYEGCAARRTEYSGL